MQRRQSESIKPVHSRSLSDKELSGIGLIINRGDMQRGAAVARVDEIHSRTFFDEQLEY